MKTATCIHGYMGCNGALTFSETSLETAVYHNPIVVLGATDNLAGQLNTCSKRWWLSTSLIRKWSYDGSDYSGIRISSVNSITSSLKRIEVASRKRAKLPRVQKNNSHCRWTFCCLQGFCIEAFPTSSRIWLEEVLPFLRR
jgi:hypothetical protein